MAQTLPITLPTAAAVSHDGDDLAARFARIGRILAWRLWLGSVITWWIIGIPFSRLWWLVNPRQQWWILFCYGWEVPVVGWTGAVLLPYLAFRRLVRRLAQGDRHAVETAARLPARVGFMVLGTSTFGYAIGAMQVDRFAALPPLEFLKIVIQGPVLGAMFGVAAYLLTERAVRAAIGLVPVSERDSWWPTGQSLYSKVLTLTIVVTTCVAVPILLHGITVLQRELEQQRGAALLRALNDGAGGGGIDAALMGLGPHTYAFVVRRSNNLIVAGKGQGRVLFGDGYRDFGVIQLGEEGWFASRDGEHKVVAYRHRPGVLPDGDGAVLVAVSPIADYGAALVPAARTTGVLALCALGVGLALAAMLTRNVVSPIVRLHEAAAQMAGGDLHVPPVPIASTDEVGTLTRAFNQMATRVRADAADLRAVIDELWHTHEQLVQAERLSAVGRLVSGVAHELNNPLAAILHCAENMSADGPRSERDLEALGAIVEQSRRCRKVVRDLLFFVRGRDERRGWAEARDIVERTRLSVSPALRQLRVELATGVPDRLPPLLVDRVGIEQVLSNLILNGAQAAGPGGHVTVTVTGESGGGWNIEVADDGPGVPHEYLSRIFEPFFTTKPQGQGTGLGLAVALGIVEQHGGSILVENRPMEQGRGARARVRLPAQPLEGPVLTPPTAPRDAPAGGGRRVLIVDDETVLRMALRRYFERQRWQVEEASDGEVALGILKGAPEDHYAAILTDLKMPGLSGVALHDWLAEHRRDLYQRLIIMTGDVASPAATTFLARTARPVLEKPFELGILAEVLTKLMG